MPSANPRITRIATKPSSLATAPILESCSAMPRPRVPLSTLERVSARPTTRAPPRSQLSPAVSQPLPAAAQPTKKHVPKLTEPVPESLSQRAAAVLERVKARSNQLAAAKRPVSERSRARAAFFAKIEEQSAAREERLRQINLEAEERRRRWGKQHCYYSFNLAHNPALTVLLLPFYPNILLVATFLLS